MRVIIAGIPAMGHLGPLISIARLLISRGHEVIGYTAIAFRQNFIAAGAQFSPIPSSIDSAIELGPERAERARLAPGPEQLLYDFKTFFIEPALEQYRGLRQLLNSFPADLIIADVAFFGTLVMLLDRQGDRPAIIHAGVSVLLSARDDEAPFGLGLPPVSKAEDVASYRQLAREVNSVLFDPATAYFNTKLAEEGIAPLQQSLWEAAVALPDAYLQLTVPSFEYPRRSMPASVRFVGSLPLAPSSWPVPSWSHELDGTRRHVLVTQGTAANGDLGELIGPVISALSDREDLLVIVTTGGRPIEAVPGPIPSNVRLAEFLDYNWLLPRLHAVITNGGYGTVSLALRFGLPLIVAGKSEDKAEIAARVAWSGAGINLNTQRPADAAIREAVSAVLGDEQYRSASRRLARQFAQYDTEAEILQTVAEVTRARVPLRRQA